MKHIITQVLPVFCLVAACALGLPLGAHAQASPSAAEMIEQLKAPPAPARPMTRSLRNLTVEAAGTPVAAAPRPSLSLLIQFDFNSSRIKPESQQALTELAQALQSPELGESRFAVEGHTDAAGRADYNLRLSQQRADEVAAFLAQHGVVASRLASAGKGASEPANPADPLAAENRRVRIVNLN